MSIVEKTVLYSVYDIGFLLSTPKLKKISKRRPGLEAPGLEIKEIYAIPTLSCTLFSLKTVSLLRSHGIVVKTTGLTLKFLL